MGTVFPAGFLFLIIALFGASFGAAGPAHADASNGVQWRVGDTAYVAGRNLIIDHKISGSLTVTGETVTLTQGAEISDDVWIAGRHVAFEGDVGGELAVRAQDALINGHVKGDVSFYGAHLAFGPDARIDGDVRYFATSPAEIDSGAVIRGNMRASTMQSSENMRGFEPVPRSHWRDRLYMPDYRISWAGAAIFGVIAGLVALIAPFSTSRLAVAARVQPLAALALGALWLVATPILALLAAFTIIGLPFAFFIMLLWPISMFVGLVVSIIVLGQMLTGALGLGGDSTVRRMAGVALATFILWVGISLPALGALIWLGAVSLGIGAMGLAGRARYMIR